MHIPFSVCIEAVQCSFRISPDIIAPDNALDHHAIRKLDQKSAVLMKPNSHLTEDLRALIRDSKALLIDWVKDGIDAGDPAPEQLTNPTHPTDWHALDAAYLAHHFNCRTCIAAGRGRGYGLRCGAGAALWRAYSEWRP